MVATDAVNGTPAARRLRVCVLQCSYEGSESVLKDVDPYRVPEVYDKEGKYQWEHAYIKKATAVQQVRDLARSKKYDVFMNLCDGAYDEDRAGQEVVEALERFGCAYTGADRVFYEPSKELMKRMAHYYDITTAPWAFICDVDMQDDAVALEQVQEAAGSLRYPLIVKHFNGYSSVGMGKDSKVQDAKQLVHQVRKFVGAFGGALVEEFIPGREFTVLVLENGLDADAPHTLLPVECRFAPGEDFKHFDLKWNDYGSMQWVPLDAAQEPELNRGLRQQAALAFVALKGCSYGRCDFRVDPQGKIFFLEINPNCGIFYPEDAHGSADVILHLDPHVGPARFIDHIVQCGVARRERLVRKRATEVKYRHGRGYGMYAARDLRPGEVVIAYEERMHCIVTQRHLLHSFGPDALPGPCPLLRHLEHLERTRPQQQPRGPGAAPIGQEQHLLASTSGQQRQQPVGSNGHAGEAPGASHQHSDGTNGHVGEAPEAPGASHQHLDGTNGHAAFGGPSEAAVAVAAAAAGGAPPPSPEPGGQEQVLAAGQPHPDPLAPIGGGAAVTKTYIQRLKAQWFKQYAYPLTDEVWVTWSDEPEDYLPINHSCEPNTWLEGLNLVATRPISKGEQVVCDYATFCVHNMEEFTCSCGTAKCRGTVKGSDYLEPWMDEVYGPHVSDYVATKRALLKAHGLRSSSLLPPGR